MIRMEKSIRHIWVKGKWYNLLYLPGHAVSITAEFLFEASISKLLAFVKLHETGFAENSSVRSSL